MITALLKDKVYNIVFDPALKLDNIQAQILEYTDYETAKRLNPDLEESFATLYKDKFNITEYFSLIAGAAQPGGLIIGKKLEDINDPDIDSTDENLIPIPVNIISTQYTNEYVKCTDITISMTYPTFINDAGFNIEQFIDIVKNDLERIASIKKESITIDKKVTVKNKNYVFDDHIAAVTFINELKAAHIKAEEVFAAENRSLIKRQQLQDDRDKALEVLFNSIKTNNPPISASTTFASFVNRLDEMAKKPKTT